MFSTHAIQCSVLRIPNDIQTSLNAVLTASVCFNRLLGSLGAIRNTKHCTLGSVLPFRFSEEIGHRVSTEFAVIPTAALSSDKSAAVP